MLRTAPKIFTNLAQKWLPDAYLFALSLTFIVFASGVFISGKAPMEMIGFWGDGFWNLLRFSMQMALILVFGFTLAKTTLVSIGLKKVAGLARNNVQAVVVVTAGSIVTSYINWGFGLVCSALLAVELAKRLQKVNYGLLVSSAYSGFLVWHGGLSGSIPLKLTDPDPSMQTILGADSMGIESTLYSGLNITLLLATILALLTVNALMARDSSQEREIKPEEIKPEEAPKDRPQVGETFAAKLENSKLASFGIGAFFVLYCASHFLGGGSLNLNIVIFIFMGLAVILHVRPLKFLSAFNESVESCAGILLQFPFYAGIMGMMSSSGLAASLSEFFISIADKNTFLGLSYLSAGIVNFFVPSGGGQWAIQGPIMLPAAKELGAGLADTSMAIAWGDAWTNMVQPFWALPLLSAGKCKLKDMMGYSAIVFLTVGAVHLAVFSLYSVFI